MSRKSHRADKSPLRPPHISHKKRPREVSQAGGARKTILFEVTSKPYRSQDLVRALVIVQEIVTAGTATPPFPPCFRLLRKIRCIRPSVAGMSGPRTIENLLRQQAELAKFGSFAFRDPDLNKVLTEARAFVRTA